MERYLACNCKDTGCDRWEVRLKAHHDLARGEQLEDVVIRCKTCSLEIPASVSHHDQLITVER